MTTTYATNGSQNEEDEKTNNSNEVSIDNFQNETFDNLNSEDKNLLETNFLQTKKDIQKTDEIQNVSIETKCQNEKVSFNFNLI